MGHELQVHSSKTKNKDISIGDFVFDKSIFNNVFDKDVRRVFIYKKAERLAKAIHLVAPAFSESAPLKNRIDSIAVGLVDAAIRPLGSARAALSRELLALSSLLSIARTGRLLSPMNADLIAREAHTLLEEIASYEEPRLSLDDPLSLAMIAKRQSAPALGSGTVHRRSPEVKGHTQGSAGPEFKDRTEAILSVIKDKQKASIKDISTHVRGVSEKTIQRELATLISLGKVSKQGERRWSTYSLIAG